MEYIRICTSYPTVNHRKFIRIMCGDIPPPKKSKIKAHILMIRSTPFLSLQPIDFFSCFLFGSQKTKTCMFENAYAIAREKWKFWKQLFTERDQQVREREGSRRVNARPCAIPNRNPSRSHIALPSENESCAAKGGGKEKGKWDDILCEYIVYIHGRLGGRSSDPSD